MKTNWQIVEMETPPELGEMRVYRNTSPGASLVIKVESERLDERKARLLAEWLAGLEDAL
ncbi:MAG: hypothetical protein ABIG63_16510 [Chloroflexota bacterium]